MPVSVVIPAYRARSTVANAIESVERQTLRPYEIIVVDDASADGTMDVIRTLQSKYPDGWIKTVELAQNVGAGEARNAGWDIAQGTCVAFLDADDTWHPRKLEIQWRYFSLNPSLALCGHGFRFAWEPEADLPESVEINSKPVLRNEILLRNPFVTPSAMILRNLPFRFCTGKRHMEDHFLWMEIILSGYSCVKLNARLASIGKPQFGAGGLSAQLWAMEKGELDNYGRLRKLGHISPVCASFLSIYSILKYIRRLLIVGLRRLW